MIYSMTKPGTEPTKFLSLMSVAVLHFSAKDELKLRRYIDLATWALIGSFLEKR